MKRLVFLLGCFALMAAACGERQVDPPAPAPASEAATAPVIWMTDYKAALEKAKADRKHVLLDFTGSDWCPWCIRLEKEVFSQPEFKAYAATAFVLVKLDFPQRTPQPAALKAQNEALSRQYGIEGFPTILILNPDGNLVETTSYREGGATAYVEHLKGILGRQSK
jgi:protein disulfide-isomerase